MAPLLSQHSFAAYGVSHWVVVVLLAAGALVLAWLGGRYRGTRTAWMLGRVLAVVVLAFLVPIQIYDLSPTRFQIENSLPFQISDLAWMAAAYALWSRTQWAYALTYYWGLTLVPQALITPALESPTVLSIDFLSFWGQHLLVVWAAVYLTWWVGMRPDWRSFAFAASVSGMIATTPVIARIIGVRTRGLGGTFPGRCGGPPSRRSRSAGVNGVPSQGILTISALLQIEPAHQ